MKKNIRGLNGAHSDDPEALLMTIFKAIGTFVSPAVSEEKAVHLQDLYLIGKSLQKEPAAGNSKFYS